MADEKISELPAAAALDGSELVPIVQAGDTVRTTALALGGGYKIYRALLTQSGSGDPVAVILENTLGGVPVWTRFDVGQYLLTLAGAFPTRDQLFMTVQTISGKNVVDIDTPPDIVYLETRNNSNAAADGFLTSSEYQILVYP